MKISRRRLIRTRRKPTVTLPNKRHVAGVKYNIRNRVARHVRQSTDMGSEGTYIEFRIPMIDTELFSLEIHRSWRTIYPEDNER